MKASRFLMLAVAAIAASATAGATGLVPEQCSFDYRKSFVHPLDFADIHFDGAIRPDENQTSRAYVLCGEDTVARSTGIQVDNYFGDKRTQGRMVFWFSGELLPLGKDYTFVVEAGSAVSWDDAAIPMDEYRTDFSVPADLGETWPLDIEQWSEVEYLKSFQASWMCETDPVGEPIWFLYKDGELEDTFPAQVGWDWGLGWAGVSFGDFKPYEKGRAFEKGHHYALVLPAGSVCSCYRDDIVNREVRVDFYGGWIDREDPLEWHRCSIFYDHPNDSLGEVWFEYDVPVSVADGGKVQLYEDGVLVKEADAYIDTSVNCFHINADFQDYPLKEACYTFVIPEGTVMAEDGTGRLNARQSMSYDFSTTKVDGVEAQEGVEYFNLNGMKVSDPRDGVFIRVSGGKTSKVAVR